MDLEQVFWFVPAVVSTKLATDRSLPEKDAQPLVAPDGQDSTALIVPPLRRYSTN
jgi:hypothetical protein